MKGKVRSKGSLKTTRRSFLKTIPGIAAACMIHSSCSPPDDSVSETLAYGPRQRIPNPYINSLGDPIMVVMNGRNFTNMLTAGLTALGGLTRLVSDNQTVLVKPNLNHREPYPGICSPYSIAEIVREVRKISSGQIKVGDEGWEGSDLIYPYLDLETHVGNAGGNLIQFSDTIPVRNQEWPENKPDFQVYTDVYDAAIIINTCVIKRHANALLTCAIKCNMGTMRGDHMTYTRQYIHNSSNFMRELAEMAALTNPELTIVDARSILTENGPWIRDGVVVDGVNKVIICGDMVATDAYCARLMSQYDETFSVSDIGETLQQAQELGLGTADLDRVELIEINT